MVADVISPTIVVLVEFCRILVFLTIKICVYQEFLVTLHIER